MSKLARLLSPFQPSDLPELISLLNETEKNLRDFRPYTEEEFSLIILQDQAFNARGLLLARESSRLLGAAFALVDPEYASFQNQRRGFVRWIRARDDGRADGLRKTLLRASLRFIASKGMEEAQVSVPNHNQYDLDFYARNGFSLVRRFNYMERPLLEKSPETLLPSGYAWTHFRKGEEEEWVNCINSAFTNHWGKRPTSLSEFVRWTADPSFDPRGIIGIRKKRTLVGVIYCEIDASYNDYTGRKRSMLWIIGVIPSERGLGLGEGLTIEGMNWSLSRGMRIAALYVDGENKPALSLYRKLKFERAYQIHHLVRPLKRPRHQDS